MKKPISPEKQEESSPTMDDEIVENIKSIVNELKEPEEDFQLVDNEEEF